MRELSLFTGAGGGILGSKLLGWKTVGYVEWEPYCQKVIAQRINDGIFDNAPIFGDIRAFIDQYANRYRGLVDVLTGGFPCQPFSIAGQQLGENDPRNRWPETAECIRIIRPGICYFENVAALLTSGYFEKILCDLHEMGYNVRWCVLSASDVGAPHKRDRLWIFAYSKRRGREEGSNERIRSESKESIRSESFKLRCAFPDSTKQGLEGQVSESWEWEYDGLPSECRWWSTEPGMGRVVDGLANRTHRLKAIGNGQVPLTMAAAFQALSEGIV